MKKLLSLVLLLAMLCTTALAYSPEEPITITFWHTRGSGANYEALLHLVNSFNEGPGKEKGIIVEESYIGDYTTVKTKCQLATQSGEQPVLAIMGCAHYQQLLEDDLLVNMYDLAANDPEFDINNILDCFVGTIGNEFDQGNFHNAPYIRSTPVLYYNKTLADAKGQTLSHTPTIDEWVAFARAMTEKDENGETTRWGMTILGNYSYIGFAFTRQLGAPLFADDCTGSPAAESGVLLKNLSDWASWKEEGIYRPQDPTGTAYSQELLYQGKIASLVTSSGSCGNIAKQMAAAGYELGVVCYPTYDLSKNSTEIGGGNLAMISKGNTEEQIKAGWEFIKYSLTDEMVYNESITSGYVPVTKSIANYQPMIDFWAANPHFKVSYDQFSWGVCQEFPYWEGMSEGLAVINEQYSYLIQEGSITPEEAVEQFILLTDGIWAE